MNKVFFLLGLVIMFVSCKEDHLPKPKAFLALEYPTPEYEIYSFGCPYKFDKNNLAQVSLAKGNVPCWININYPLLDATIFITYQSVNNNIDSLLRDAQRMPLQHTIKADYIEGDIYSDPETNSFGMFYEIEGNAASQAQFYITDSIKHFVTGSLYFNQKPNYDSIMPAASYLKTDMKHLMETIIWEDVVPENSL